MLMRRRKRKKAKEPYSARNDQASRGKSNIAPETPLRLDVAVREAFPAGGMTVSGLRREIVRGRLEVELIAGKQLTTLSAIAKMRAMCRVPAKSEIQIAPSRAEGDCALSASQERLLARLGEDQAKLKRGSKR
jgi:hypothetical protein